MSLIKCHECGEAVSGIGQPCPKCGAFILKTERVIGFNLSPGLKWMLFIFAIILVFIVWKFAYH